jgi:endoribonuclease Dicer
MSTLGNLGPYCASLFLYSEIQRLFRDILQGRPEQSHDSVDLILLDYKYQDSQEKEINFVLDILEDFQDFFPPDALSCDSPAAIGLDWCTPKVKVLVDLLLEFEAKSSTFQCIIFVEQRQVASMLSKVLQVIPDLNSKIKSAFLVGQGVNSEGVTKHSDRNSGNAVKMFKDGLINVRKSVQLTLDFFSC